MNPCCDNPNTHLISGGRSAERHETVTVCERCGHFSVRIEEKGVHVSTGFKLYSQLSLIAASQTYRSTKTEQPVEIKRVWKPLDLAHRRLYDVVLSYQEKGSERSRRIHYTVASTAPRHAAELVRNIYKDFYENKERFTWWDVHGQALNVLQPLDWTENGISLLNHELLDAVESHLDNCFGCKDDKQTDEGLAPCEACQKLEELILVRHNHSVEDDRSREGKL